MGCIDDNLISRIFLLRKELSAMNLLRGYGLEKMAPCVFYFN